MSDRHERAMLHLQLYDGPISWDRIIEIAQAPCEERIKGLEAAMTRHPRPTNIVDIEALEKKVAAYQKFVEAFDRWAANRNEPGWDEWEALCEARQRLEEKG